jgi:hypothetical protein
MSLKSRIERLEREIEVPAWVLTLEEQLNRDHRSLSHEQIDRLMEYYNERDPELMNDLREMSDDELEQLASGKTHPNPL